MITDKNAPAAAAAAGMTKLVFCDDFDSYDTIDFSAEGKPGYNWYVDRPYGGITFTKEELKMEDSVLHFVPEHCAAAVGIPTYSKKGKTGFLMHYGYLEARMRFATKDIVPHAQREGWPAFWGMALCNVMGERRPEFGELDVFEGVLVRPDDGNSGVIYTGTLHDHRREYTMVDGVEQEKRMYGNNPVNNCGYRDQFAYLDDDWHTYAALWEPGHVAWYLDGVEMHSARYRVGALPEYYYRDDPRPLPRIEDSKPELAGRTWPGAHHIMEMENEVIILGCNKHWPMDVDWVRIWQA